MRRPFFEKESKLTLFDDLHFSIARAISVKGCGNRNPFRTMKRKRVGPSEP
jgi:hypothetical protein